MKITVMSSQFFRFLSSLIFLFPLLGFGQVLISDLNQAKQDPKSVIRLDLSHQSVGEIPLALKEMKSLRSLDLSHNQIDTIPPLLLSLKNLDTLIISHNSISILPSKLCFSSINYFDVQENPVVSRSYKKCFWTKPWTFLWGELNPTPKPEKQEDGFIMAETQPQILNQIEIIEKIKSEEAYQKERKKGKVVLRIKVDRDGKYTDHRVLQSDDEDLVALLEAYLKDMRFMPAFNKGKPLSFWVNVNFEF